MKQTWLIMGMSITVVIDDEAADEAAFRTIHDYFRDVDRQYSPYKPASEVSKINAGLPKEDWSREIKTIMRLCEQTKVQTNGYFDVWHRGKLDPSGLVKGWAIAKAADRLRAMGFRNFYIEAGGDIQASGHKSGGRPWTVGIRNPFKRDEIVKVLRLDEEAVATSGTYTRGQHIYNPHGGKTKGIASLSVVGPTIYDADRFATAAFAMGQAGIGFIESLKGFEGYMINNDRQATMTSGFGKYAVVSR